MPLIGKLIAEGSSDMLHLLRTEYSLEDALIIWEAKYVPEVNRTMELIREAQKNRR